MNVPIKKSTVSIHLGTTIYKLSIVYFTQVKIILLRKNNINYYYR